MDEIIVLPEIGSLAFWDLYDQFCSPVHLEKFIETGRSDQVAQMCQMMEVSHRARTIHYVSRPERGWGRRKAWLVLRDVPVRNEDGAPAVQMRIGDVVTLEPGWDRDVFITHNPIREVVSGYLLSGKWEEMIGLFMPLFDKATIMKCIELRTGRNAEAIARAEKQAHEWMWY